MTTRWHELLKYIVQKSPKSWNFSRRRCRKYTWGTSAEGAQNPTICYQVRWTSPEFHDEDRISVRCFVVYVSWAVSWLVLPVAGNPLEGSFHALSSLKHLELLLGRVLFLRIIKLCYLGLHLGRNAHNFCLLWDSQFPLPKPNSLSENFQWSR